MRSQIGNLGAVHRIPGTSQQHRLSEDLHPVGGPHSAIAGAGSLLHVHRTRRSVFVIHPVDDSRHPEVRIRQRHLNRGERFLLLIGCGHPTGTPIRRVMGHRALDRVVVVSPATIHPFEMKQPLAVHQFVQHPRGNQLRSRRVLPLFRHGYRSTGRNNPKPKCERDPSTRGSGRSPGPFGRGSSKSSCSSIPRRRCAIDSFQRYRRNLTTS